MYYNKLAQLFTVFVTTVPAYVAASTTLLDVYSDALNNDPELKAEHALTQAEVERREAASGSLLPSVTLSGEIARNREDVETTGIGTQGLSYFDSNQLELTLKQPLYRKDIYADVDARRASSLAAEYDYRSTAHELIMRVTRQYLAVLAARNDLEYIETEKNAIDEQLQNARKRHKAGISTNADLYEAQASYDLAIAQVIVAESNLFDANASLEEITDRQYGDLSDLKDDFTPGFTGPAELQYWIDAAERGNPQLTASRYRIATLQHEVERSSAGHYPRLDIVAKYSSSETGGRFGDSNIDDQSIALQLEVPIYEGGKVNAQVRESISRLDAEKEKLTKIHRQITREISKAFKSTQSTINRVSALKQAVKSAESALSAIKSGYKAGSRTSSDILDAQQALFKAKRDYMQEQYKYILSYLELKQLAGSISIDDVKHVSQWFKK